MNAIEQQLWDYIDGNLDADQQKILEQKLHSDPALQQQYEALLSLNGLLNGLELEEPSMSFTRNLMKHVALEAAPVTLKTKVDQRIIGTIAGFFILSLLGLIGYVIAQSDFSMSEIKLNLNIDFEKYLSPMVLYVFFGVDLILALIFVDYLLRKKMQQHQNH